MNTEHKLMGAGVFSAIAASLCCLTPLLTLIAGTSGWASTFSWLEPFRPYTFGLTVVLLSFAWYHKSKPLLAEECACETDRKPNFVQSKVFLGIITVLSFLLLTYPYYSTAYYYSPKKSALVVAQTSAKKVVFTVNGMTCTSCAEHIDHELTKLNGIVQSKASFDNGNAEVEFDNTKITLVEVEKAINLTGYVVTGKKEL